MTFSERAIEAAARKIDERPFEEDCEPGSLGAFNAQGRKERAIARARACLIAALAVDGPALQGWRTIDSAPKDGTEVLLWFPFTPDKPHWSHPTGFVFLAKWWISDGIDEDRWVDPDDCEDLGSTPTHWQPLPSPPHTAASDGEVG